MLGDEVATLGDEMDWGADCQNQCRNDANCKGISVKEVGGVKKCQRLSEVPDTTYCSDAETNNEPVCKKVHSAHTAARIASVQRDTKTERSFWHALAVC